MLDAQWVGSPQRRKRQFVFGSRSIAKAGAFHVEQLALHHVGLPPVTSSDGGRKGKANWVRTPRYTVAEMVELQGLPSGLFEHSPLTVEGKKHALANGVPLPMGRAVARAVKRAIGS